MHLYALTDMYTYVHSHIYIRTHLDYMYTHKHTYIHTHLDHTQIDPYVYIYTPRLI